MRESCISKESCAALEECIHKEVPDPSPLILFPTKKLADQINRFENLTLETESVAFKRTFNTPAPAQIHNDLLNMCEETIELKVGSHVMCVVNQEKIVNGSQGVVVGFEGEFPVIDFAKVGRLTIKPHVWTHDKYPKYTVSQLPLILAWAITIHKSQGITLDSAYINIGSSVFEYGQSYVALSRLSSIKGLYLKGLDVKKIKVNPKVIEFYNSLSRSQMIKSRPESLAAEEPDVDQITERLRTIVSVS
jgi:ATP-dependent DNA helicase PIF1